MGNFSSLKWHICLVVGIVVLICFIDNPYWKFTGIQSLKYISKQVPLKQDTALEIRKRNALLPEPDTNFTWEKYAAFLTKVSDTSKYTVLPVNEFRKTFDPNKIVIGLRHDVDVDLDIAYKFSEVEANLGFRSSYFILHTAPYYLANPDNKAVHTANILPVLRTMQNDRHFEIGWHNDLVTLQLIYKINPVEFLHNELGWLRSNGINIIGTAAHGSEYCKVYHYMNFYFFEECTFPVVPNRENNIAVPLNGKNITIEKAKLSDFNLEYEAYFLNNNKAFSDATITNGIRWNIGMLDISQLAKGDRVIILIHPIHWHKASTSANIESFSVKGQKSSSIDAANSAISILMPYGTNRNLLIPEFTLSPGAYSKISGKLQISGKSSNNFFNRVICSVYAENRDIRKEWTIDIHNEKNSACNFEYFFIPGVTKTVDINTVQKTIMVIVDEGTDLGNLPVHFVISPGASAWIENTQQFSNVGAVNFSKSVQYTLMAEDGIASSKWNVTVVRDKDSENKEIPKTVFSVYPNPSDGKIHMKFSDIRTSPTRIDIFDASGKKVYTNSIYKTGNFTFDADISGCPSGVYIVKHSQSQKSVLVVIQKK
jgi:hypothetical protein